MIYFYAQPLENYKHSDAKRFKIIGYPGGIYKAVDTAEYGGGVEHCTEWVEKYSYTIKTKAEAQALVNSGIVTLNNSMSDETLGGQTPVQEDITLE